MTPRQKGNIWPAVVFHVSRASKPLSAEQVAHLCGDRKPRAARVALKQLEEEGLVRKNPQRGHHPATFDWVHPSFSSIRAGRHALPAVLQ